MREVRPDIPSAEMQKAPDNACALSGVHSTVPPRSFTSGANTPLPLTRAGRKGLLVFSARRLRGGLHRVTRGELSATVPFSLACGGRLLFPSSLLRHNCSIASSNCQGVSIIFCKKVQTPSAGYESSTIILESPF